MKQYKNSLIIGRFQPTCINHMDLVSQAAAISDNVLIGIGRPNYSVAKERLEPNEFLRYQIKNIFSYDKTIDLLATGIHDYGVCENYFTTPIHDIFDGKNYANHVVNQFTTYGINLEDCTLIGENEWTIECFKNIMPITRAIDNTGFHATEVRRGVMNGEHYGLAAKLTEAEIKRVAECQRLLDYNGNLERELQLSYYDIIN